MNLDQALRIFHIIWLRGEPIIGVSRAQQALNELINQVPPKTWVMATGLGDPNKNENWGSAVVKQPIAAEQELIGALLDAGRGETPVGSGTWPPGLVVLAEGLKLGAHVQAAAMKVISGDGRVIFVSSGDPPEDFLKDYLKIVDLEYDTLSDDLGEICRNNSRQFSEEMVSVLTGLRPYRSASVLAESIAMTEPNKELPYIYMSRGDAIRDDSDGIITYLEPTIKFKDLIGLDRAKRLFSALSSRTKTTKVRGVLCMGVPGTGKTSLALAVAGESKSPLYFVDVGSVFNALVGRSEERARRAIQVLKKAPPGYVLLDEVEKSLSGSSQGAEGGGGHGTSIRAGMYFLQYLDNPVAANGDGYHVIIGTSNDIFSLPPEFTRAGRWDAIFSFLLPTGSQLKKVLALYRKQYNLPTEFGKDADMDRLTPAEVEATCRIASILQTTEWDEAIQYVPRLSKFRNEDIVKITEECLGRAVSADDDDAIGKLVSKSRKVKR